MLLGVAARVLGQSVAQHTVRRFIWLVRDHQLQLTERSPRDEMRAKLDSQVADLANIGNRFGGALQAGAFLKEFVGETQPWAHLDIAGPARNTDAAHGYTPKGGTGFGVRTLVSLAQRLA